MSWLKRLRGRVRPNQRLDKYTSFKIGGRARFFIEPKDVDELKILILKAKKQKLPLFIIGQGTNLLISKRYIKGMVIRLSSPEFKRITLKGNTISISSGLRLQEVIEFAKKRCLGGLEFLAGIPGTVGGALVMNAGISEKVKDPCLSLSVSDRPAGKRQASGRQEESRVKRIGDLLKDVTVMDRDGRINTLKRNEIQFGYRKSNLSKYIILGASLNLVKRDRVKMKKMINGYLMYRKKAHKVSYPNAGCIFKNPAGSSAGRLIDLCDLKGRRCGDAEVSYQHANYIVNRGKAKPEDVLGLMDLVRRDVRKKFGIDLEPEIKIW